jgi:o-succinylbenzoate synthase
MNARIDQVRLHRIDMPLVRPFRTSFGTQHTRDVLLLEVRTSDGVSGWGECVAMSWPGYSPEYVDGCVDVITEHLLPRVLDSGSLDPFDVHRALAPIQGHPMSKTALETAVLDAWLRTRGERLVDFLASDLLGVSLIDQTRERVDCGVSVGIPPSESIAELLEEVAGYLDEGYRRIKLKIEPGWDLEPVRAVRESWPNILLQTDANQAYTRADAAHLGLMDSYNLLLVEQPLPEDDLVGHARLAAQITTPVCLDESITSVAVAESALELQATTIINIKPGRVGGYLTSREIHDLCRERGVPVWCGGMLETGVGRAANVALAALPGFTLPGDTSGSHRYYAVDITPPFVLDDGQLEVPRAPGIGVDPIPEILAELSTWSAHIDR